MNQFDKWVGVALKALLFITCVVVLSVLISPAPVRAEEVKAKYLATDVGFVIITDQPCEIPFNEPVPFKWRAYATEYGHDDHEGCWYLDTVGTGGVEGAAVAIFFPEIGSVAVYNPAIFKDKPESF